MKLRHSLATGVAVLGLAVGSAWANGNEAYTNQNGNDNKITASQYDSGQKAGSDADPMNQEGNSNSISINQREFGGAGHGNGSTVGLSGEGVDQVGNSNSLGISQTNSGGDMVHSRR